MNRPLRLTPIAAVWLSTFGMAATPAQAITPAVGAIIEISSRDAAGVGFNDPTPVEPVGGNPGTTLGEQRLFVYRYVADLWQQAIKSNVTIKVSAGWEALACTSTTAVLGSAGAWNIWHDFPNGAPGTWYHQALANSLAGTNLSDGTPDDGTGYGNVDIKTQFNVNLGNAGCLDGQGFYLGVDGKAGSQINFVATLLHELGHGLGFTVLTSNQNGNRISPVTGNYVATGGLPAIWEGYLLDTSINKTWLQMTNAERQASAVKPLQLAWTGANAVSGAAATLSGTPVVQVFSPVPGTIRFSDYGTASFGPAVAGTNRRFGVLVNSLTDGCTAYDAAATAALTGKTAVIDRGTCAFVTKVKNAQNAGATAVIIANNAPGTAPGLGGSDATITIPVVSVTQADGANLKTAIAQAPRYGSRSKPGLVSASLGFDTTRLAGADSLGRPLMNTPATLAPGSSVSHYDPSAFPNLLMEPAINSDLTTLLVPPKDITLPLLLDIGWKRP